MDIGNFFGDTFHKLIYHQLCKIQRIWCKKHFTAFQFKVLCRNIKETILARYLIKVTEHPSFTRLRVMNRMNRVHLNIKIENMLQRFISTSYLNLGKINSFSTIFSFVYTLKDQKTGGVFRGCKSGTLVENGLKL